MRITQREHQLLRELAELCNSGRNPGPEKAAHRRKPRMVALPCPGSTVALELCFPGQVVVAAALGRGGHFPFLVKEVEKRRERKKGSAPPRQAVGRRAASAGG